MNIKKAQASLAARLVECGADPLFAAHLANNDDYVSNFAQGNVLVVWDDRTFHCAMMMHPKYPWAVLLASLVKHKQDIIAGRVSNMENPKIPNVTPTDEK